MTLAERIFSVLVERIFSVLVENGKPLSIQKLYEEIQDKPKTTIRGRIYENLGRMFKKVARGVYWIENDESACVVVEADGRKEGLSLLDSNSIDAIVCDHPWDDSGNKGTNRNFTSDYNCFQYTLSDFQEKARVLKDGAFLVEVLPNENSTNFQYLYNLKMMAKEAGFEYYAKIPWKKGNFIANTGRSSKNSEDIMIFHKGAKARKLRPDTKKIRRGDTEAKMSGTAYMLPTCFDVEPPSRKERIHQAEKPIDLFTKIIEAITLPGEIIVDQFAGSGALGASILSLKNRIGILFESLKSNVKKIAKRLNATCIYAENYKGDEIKAIKGNVREPFHPVTLNSQMEQLSLF